MTLNLALPDITRIPITGPEPYNTLVCVKTISHGGSITLERGKLTQYPITVPTKFKLAGYDQRITPAFDHSTTAFINSIGPAEDDSWVFAVDAVTGAGFDPADWTFFVNLDMGIEPPKSLSDNCVYYGVPEQGGFEICDVLMTMQISSFVLCWEPPLPERHAHAHRASAPPALPLPEREAADIVERLALRTGRPLMRNAALAAIRETPSCTC